jgi:hypothetical protein
MKTHPLIAILFAASLFAPRSAAAETPLETGFANPPEQTKPWCYWYWISDNISKEGITKDLEAMKRFGIGEALIGNIFQENQAVGPVKVLSEEWWQLIEHAIREGGRVGVNIGMFNCPGWSQSGGPWIKPEQAMRYMISSETRVTGPKRFVGKLATPKAQFQDVAVLAFPAPSHDGDTLAARLPQVKCAPAVAGAGLLVDGNPETSVAFPVTAGGGNASVAVDIDLAEPLTARTLQVTPSGTPFGAQCVLQAADESGAFRDVRRFKCDRSNMGIGVGFMPRGPVTVSFPATTARRFRLVFSGFFGRGGKVELAEIDLSGAARLEGHVEKQLGKMHPTPLPLWDAYLWPAPPEPDAAGLAVPLDNVVDLTKNLAADGTLTWEVPAGEWVILRNGMTPTGTTNSPASPEGQGLEVDKMNHGLARGHFDAFIGVLLKRMPAAERKAFTRVIADSYEMGSQNWTDGFAGDFRATYGYDPIPWLPVLSGRIVGSAGRSERFLWDLRRLVADRVATEYVGGLREAANAHGLGLWLENYGHWGFPGEFLQYGSQSDRIGGEFWVTGDLGSIECRAASSCANTYGKPFVSAESFTGGPPFQNSPGALKARGDWSFCEGVNHAVLHVCIQQPAEGKPPGINAPWGTEFNRLNTWFEPGRAWVDYERRCCWLLQQGWRVADVAYFIGEDAPKMTGICDPALPAGRDFDYINADVIMNRLAVKDGRLVLPHGAGYRLLVLPRQDTMRPELLRKVLDLVKAGATVMGTPPKHSPSLRNFPQCDAEVRELAAELWGAGAVAARGERKFGDGRVIWGMSLDEVFAENQVPPDLEYRGAAKDAKFLFTHRSSDEAEIYFITNQSDRPQTVDGVFRVSAKQPELWDAVTGERRDLTEWALQDGRATVPLSFAAKQSWFIVFRKAGEPAVGGSRNFPEMATVTTLEGPWELAFDPKWGGPRRITFAELADWSTRSEEGIRHYSGTAVYQKSFVLPAKAAGKRWILDLGDVRDMATVRLNGRELGTVWTAPWQLDISAFAKAGVNSLEVSVVNPWNNRLVGDAKLPPAKRRTSLSLNTVKAKSPLLPAGLLGPVSVRSVETPR